MMQDLQIIAVDKRAEKKRFLNFPWTLYRDNPHWIPPIRLDQKELLGYRYHAFYEENEIRTFLAVRDGVDVGRIAAIVNYGHLERNEKNLGFFGFFECIDDQQVADALFDAAGAWLRKKGLTALRGPMNPSMNYSLGLLIEGFDSPPFFMMTFNPPYYEGLMENYGFRKSQDLYAYWGNMEMLPKIREKLGPKVDLILERCNAKIRPLNRKNFFEDVRSFLDIYNRSLTNTWGFVPMSEKEVDHMAKGLKYLIVPDLAVGVEIEGKLVGTTLCLLDYNPRIKAIDGKLFPLGFWKLLSNKRAIKRVRIISTNVVPEYQMHGLSLCMLDALVPLAQEWGIEEAEFSWVLESNLFSRGSLEKGGAIRTKTYRLYDYRPEAGEEEVSTKKE
jgi:hypothetical protein